MVAAPAVLGREGGLRLAHQPVVDFLQALHRQAAARLAKRTGLVRRRFSAGQPATGLGLADGFPAGGPGLGDLPAEGPEPQAEVPAPVAGMSACLLLGQAPARDKRREEQFELVAGGAQGGAPALDLGGEVAGPEWKIRRPRTVIILSY